MNKLLLYGTAILILMSVGLPQRGNAQHGMVGQKVQTLNDQGFFSKPEKLFVLAASQENEQARSAVKSYTLVDPSQRISQIVSDKPDYISLLLPINRGNNTVTVLLYKTDISPNGLKTETSDGKIYTPERAPVNYRGAILNNSSSIAAFTFSDNEVMGLVSGNGANYVIGKMDGFGPQKHIIYNDADLIAPFNFDCGTNTLASPITKDNGGASTMSVNCVDWYWEIDNDVFVGKGSLANVNTFVNGIFNQVSTLYANDGISITLQTVYVWTTTDPYTGTSTSNYLSQFGTNRTSFAGDLATLIGYGGGGGVAYINGLCSSTQYKMAYAGISSSYNTVPTYSWTVEVVTHEQGHQLGSNHTHDCVWNGNNTRIDNCGPAAGYSSGSCVAGPIPSKGTIMSYCHLSPNPGIDLSLGFGPQPTARMLDRINAASCLSACSGCVTPSQPGSITGSATTCSSTSQTYSVTAVSGATSYTWTLPSGWSGTSTTNSITTTSGTAGGSITVKANNSCGSSAVRTLAVTVSGTGPSQPGSITGSATTCSSTSQTYFVTVVSGATSYTWTLPSGWSGTSTTNSITTTSGTAGGSIAVKANNGCGSSAVRTLAVTVTTSVPAKPGTITGAASACANQLGVPYSITSVAGATSYKWIVPSGAKISDGTVTSTGNNLTTTAISVTVNFGNTSGTVRVRAINACGMGVVRSKTVSFTCRGDNNLVTEEEVVPEIAIYPNPSNGDFTLETNTEEENVSVSVYDALGKLAKPSVENAPQTVKLSGLTPGIYSVVVKTNSWSKSLRIVKIK